jgi:hypothetical protein
MADDSTTKNKTPAVVKDGAQGDACKKDTAVLIQLHPESFRLAGYAFFWLMVLTAIIVSRHAVDPANLEASTLIDIFGYIAQVLRLCS